jgi:nucleotide-binding universal stress UspA family protein
MLSTVAVGTDGSETATKAVGEAAETARRFGAKLALLSAFQDTSRTPATRDSEVELQWPTNSAARMREILERNEENLRGSGPECESRADHSRRAGGLDSALERGLILLRSDSVDPA